MTVVTDHCVIKLGGSLLQGEYLQAWLQTIVEHGRGRAVIVPGGGHFADAVREVQSRHGFDDRSAHRLALLGMAQSGHFLMAVEPRLRPVLTITDTLAALQSDRVPVWLPISLLNDETEVPASWDWSSDSIALWLAHQIEAELCLVKSIAPSEALYTAESLLVAGIVDRAFPCLLRQTARKVYWLGPEQPVWFPDTPAGALITSRLENNASWQEQITCPYE